MRVMADCGPCGQRNFTYFDDDDDYSNEHDVDDDESNDDDDYSNEHDNDDDYSKDDDNVVIMMMIIVMTMTMQ